ncbi:Uncharacterised protein [Vibrio cholerae]|nr:Uncharacterised protein [Vibrio cholerae]
MGLRLKSGCSCQRSRLPNIPKTNSRSDLIAAQSAACRQFVNGWQKEIGAHRAIRHP